MKSTHTANGIGQDGCFFPCFCKATPLEHTLLAFHSLTFVLISAFLALTAVSTFYPICTASILRWSVRDRRCRFPTAQHINCPSAPSAPPAVRRPVGGTNYASFFRFSVRLPLSHSSQISACCCLAVYADCFHGEQNLFAFKGRYISSVVLVVRALSSVFYFELTI